MRLTNARGVDSAGAGPRAAGRPSNVPTPSGAARPAVDTVIAALRPDLLAVLALAAAGVCARWHAPPFDLARVAGAAPAGAYAGRYEIGTAFDAEPLTVWLALVGTGGGYRATLTTAKLGELLPLRETASAASTLTLTGVTAHGRPMRIQLTLAGEGVTGLWTLGTRSDTFRGRRLP